MQAFLKFRCKFGSLSSAVLDEVRTPPAQQCTNSRKKSLNALEDRLSPMTRSRGIVTLIVLLVGTILVADHVVVASDHPPTVARSSPQVTANRTLAATSTLAAHDKSGNEVRAISIQKPAAGANTPPWRPPVVNISYFGGPVMSKPIRVHLIWYVDRSLLHRLHCNLHIYICVGSILTLAETKQILLCGLESR